MEDLLQFDLPTELTSIIKVIGVGGGGSNAVNHMYKQGIKGVDFIVCNTDAQALQKSPVPIRIQLGAELTRGLGAGNRPERGRDAAVESIEHIKREIGERTQMVFITAGMGGGTGTGAAPVIAKATKEMGILTVAIVTLPFRYEGPKRVSSAVEGIRELKLNVDALIIVNNEKLREMYGDLEYDEAFNKADDVLTVAARGIAEIITKDGYINTDFADVQTSMTDGGIALMGSGKAQGEDRAHLAVLEALSSPLLDNNDIKGARKVLINISSGTKKPTMDEIGFINEYVQNAAGAGADLIWGGTSVPELGESIAVTVIATGFKTSDITELYINSSTGERIKFNDNAEHSKEGTQQIVTAEKVSTPSSQKNVNQQPEIKREQIPVHQNPIRPEHKPDEIYLITSELPVKNNDPFFDPANTRREEPQRLKQQTPVTVVSERAPQYKSAFDVEESLTKIDKYDETPAYLRSGLNIENGFDDTPKEMSKYSFSYQGDNVTFSENNPFLHDKAD